MVVVNALLVDGSHQRTAADDRSGQCNASDDGSGRYAMLVLIVQDQCIAGGDGSDQCIDGDHLYLKCIC